MYSFYNEQSFDNESNTNNKKEKPEKNKLDLNEMNIDNENNDISINSENDEEEENISDNEGYNNFMKEYKQYCKGIKKAINKHIEGELNVQDFFFQKQAKRVEMNQPFLENYAVS